MKEVVEIVDRFSKTIFPHWDDEERRVFPAVRKLVAGDPPEKVAAFLEEMRTEHDALGKDLHRLRALADGLIEPADSCGKYREMLNGLKALKKDMHVHLENNVLLPRATKLMASSSDQ